jgi:hypothetical protein
MTSSNKHSHIPPTMGNINSMWVTFSAAGRRRCKTLHSDAQKGPFWEGSFLDSFGVSWNAHPEPEKMRLALSYGNLSPHAHKSWLKEAAPSSIFPMYVAGEIFQELMSLLKDFAPLNKLHKLATFDTSQLLMSLSNEVAEAKVCHIFLTDDTSQLLISELNEVASWNKPFRLVTDPTFHLLMSELKAVAPLNIPSMLREPEVQRIGYRESRE